MAHRLLRVRLTLCGVVLALAACAPGPSPLDDDGPVRAAGNFAGALVSEDYDEAFSYMTTQAQAALGGPDALAAQFGALCTTELDRYAVQMQPTEGDGVVVNTGTLTCADGSTSPVLIVTENTGPNLWLVRDFQVGVAGSGG